MRYSKPPLSVEEQADLLLTRGMLGDRTEIVRQLSVVNYYRLSGYWHTFRRHPSHDFQDGTTFEKVWMRYVFDRELRLLVMDAVERTEVAFRTYLAHFHAHHHHDPFAYADDPAALPGLKSHDRSRFLAKLADDTENSKETFAEHFRAKYGKDHGYMPIWVACEIMTFGQVMTLFRGSSPQIKRAVAAPFAVHDTVAQSWLLTLNTIRNICAHHARLWNRQLGVKPMIPVKKNDPRWHEPVEVKSDRIFGVLTILKHCMDRVAPQSTWPSRLISHLDQYPDIPRTSMGFPAGWKACPIWAQT